MGSTTYKLSKYEKLTWYGQLFQYEILALENILLNLSNKSYFYYVELESIVFRQSKIIAKICKSRLYQSTGLKIRITMVGVLRKISYFKFFGFFRNNIIIQVPSS